MSKITWDIFHRLIIHFHAKNLSHNTSLNTKGLTRHTCYRYIWICTHYHCKFDELSQFIHRDMHISQCYFWQTVAMFTIHDNFLVATTHVPLHFIHRHALLTQNIWNICTHIEKELRIFDSGTLIFINCTLLIKIRICYTYTLFCMHIYPFSFT